MKMSSLYRYRHIFLTNVKKYDKHKRYLSYSGQKRSQSLEKTAAGADQIVIPKRIPRSPTDILDALASTVRRDPYSPPYYFIDDPEALPISSQDKKTFALAMSSGRRAAQLALEKWPKTFLTNPMDPSCEIPDAFKVFETPELEDGSIEQLEELIHLHKVQDSYTIYQKLKEAGTAIPTELHEDLLDLLCVYNSKEHEPLMIEENVYARVVTPDTARPSTKNTWNDNGPADTVFNDMDSPSLRAYSSLLKGRAKCCQVEKSVSLYREMNDKKLIPDILTYCSILKVVSMSQNQVEGKISVIKDIFEEIKNRGLEPSVELFDTAIEAINLAHITSLRSTAQFAISLLSEVYACGLEPRLSTWYNLVRIIYRENDCSNAGLHEILNRLEGKEFDPETPNDLEFFSIAMVKAQRNLNDLQLAYKIDNLLNTGDNYKMIGSNFLEGLYYNFFFKLLCTFDDIDTIMTYYHKSVPHWYTPTFTTIREFIDAIELNDGYKYLPEIWTDMYFFRYHRYPDMMKEICRLAAKSVYTEPIQEQLHQLCCALYKEIKFTVMVAEEKGYLRNEDQLRIVNAEMIGYMWQICLNSQDTAQAKEMYGFYGDYKSKLGSQLPEKTLEGAVDMFIAEGDFNNAVSVLDNMCLYSYRSIDRTAEKIKSLLKLSPDQLEIVNDTLK